MHSFVNLDNICIISDFGPNPCDPSLRVPSLSELVSDARKTGQMPYGNQRVPIPSYTNNLDDDIPYNSPDKIGACVNESIMRSRIEELELQFESEQIPPETPSETPSVSADPADPVA